MIGKTVDVKTRLRDTSPIRVLPDDVASKIAAGEVIERPASVVRELIDNAIDSGSRQIRVEIRGGGRELIRVIDDGCGIEPDQMPRAFLRHATSKIQTAEDLWAVRTLGFRGEALFSVAAVSKVNLMSRPQGAQAGYELTVDGGAVVGEGPRGTPYGTIVTVRDLFYNLPARLKFLKSPQAEVAHITALLQQYALAHPAISFTLSNDGRTSLQTPGDGDLRSAASYVYGPEVARTFLPVGVEPSDDDSWAGGALAGISDAIGVYGYVAPPVHSRSNRQGMHFFINRRAVQSRMLQFGVEEAYHSLLMVGRRPISIINVTIDPSLLDVNVHPAKAEVKFRDERAVFSAVQRAVRSSLQAHVPAPSYGSRSSEGWLVPNGDTLPSQGLGWAISGGEPMGDSQVELWRARAEGSERPADSLQGPDNGLTNGLTMGGVGGGEVEPLPEARARTLPPLRVVGQVGATYIIAEGPDGLFLVDQHAAHERVLYEKLGAELEAGGLPVQPLLQPVSLELTASQRAEIDHVLPLMLDLGFDIEPFGETSLLLRAVPAIYAASPNRQRDMSNGLIKLLDTVMRGSHAARWREEMAITLACHSAVRAGQTLSLDEMRSLLNRLELCHYPRSCAHGRPTMLHLSQMQLEREFGRRG